MIKIDGNIKYWTKLFVLFISCALIIWGIYVLLDYSGKAKGVVVSSTSTPPEVYNNYSIPSANNCEIYYNLQGLQGIMKYSLHNAKIGDLVDLTYNPYFNPVNSLKISVLTEGTSLTWGWIYIITGLYLTMLTLHY